GSIAGGTAGVVVETALRFEWKGLYSGLAGNLTGVLPASAIFVRVYEPTKRKLMETLPKNLSAVAHFVNVTLCLLCEFLVPTT
ncbi:hypothetical protein ACJX0J_021344, partial [Zea mays]